MWMMVYVDQVSLRTQKNSRTRSGTQEKRNTFINKIARNNSIPYNYRSVGKINGMTMHTMGKKVTVNRPLCIIIGGIK